MFWALDMLHDVYEEALIKEFSKESITHIVLLVMSFVFYLSFLWLLVRPFYKATSREAKRVVELLSQLPSDMDVQGLVMTAWAVELKPVGDHWSVR